MRTRTLDKLEAIAEVLDVDDLTDEEAGVLVACSRPAASKAQYKHTREFAAGTNLAAIVDALEGRGLLERKERPPGAPGVRAYYQPTARGEAALTRYRLGFRKAMPS